MVAGKFMYGKEKITIERETVYAKTEFKGRNLIVMKAEGPMGRVGRPHIGVEKFLCDPEYENRFPDNGRCRVET